MLTSSNFGLLHLISSLSSPPIIVPFVNAFIPLSIWLHRLQPILPPVTHSRRIFHRFSSSQWKWSLSKSGSLRLHNDGNKGFVSTRARIDTVWAIDSGGGSGGDQKGKWNGFTVKPSSNLQNSFSDRLTIITTTLDVVFSPPPSFRAIFIGGGFVYPFYAAFIQ